MLPCLLVNTIATIAITTASGTAIAATIRVIQLRVRRGKRTALARLNRDVGI